VCLHAQGGLPKEKGGGGAATTGLGMSVPRLRGG